MKIKCSEPTSQKYIYVDPKTNQVHLVMPLVGGESIGLDNTCQTVIELQKFFGKDINAETKRVSARHELERYQAALERDIATLPKSHARELKQQRLEQVKEYLTALRSIQSDPRLYCLSGSYPSYPEAIKRILAQRSNALSMRLSPAHPDPVLKAENPIFSVRRAGVMVLSKFEVRDTTGGFGPTLRSEFSNLTIGPKQDAKSIVQHAVLEAFRGRSIKNEADFEALKSLIQSQIKQHYNIDVDLRQTIKSPINPVTKANIDSWSGFDESDKDKIQDYFDVIVGYCLADEFWNTVHLDSAFSNITPVDGEKLSIMTQFFLGEVNIYAYANGLATTDFGAILDDNPTLCLELTDVIKESLRTSQNVEENLFAFINKNYRQFGLARQLKADEQKNLATRFNSEFATIKDSPHFDEFILFAPGKRGDFVNHHGTIALSFAQFLNMEYPEHSNKYFRISAEQFRNIAGKLDHKNPSVAADFEFDEKSLPQLLKSTKNIDTVASILSAEVAEGNLRVFQVLSDKIIVELIKSPNYDKLRSSIIAKLTDPVLQAEFNKKYPSKTQSLQLTAAMERSLYTQVAANFKDTHKLEGLSNIPTPEKLRKALELLNIKIASDGIQASEHEGYVINCPLESAVAIKGIYTNCLKTIHLTPEMARSLYLAVEARFGKESPHVIAMNQKSNQKTPEKINFALSSLDIKVNNNEFWGFNGYKVTVDPSAIEAIDSIHQSFSPPLSPAAAIAPMAAAAAVSLYPSTAAAQPKAATPLATPTQWKAATIQSGKQFPVPAPSAAAAAASSPGSSPNISPSSSPPTATAPLQQKKAGILPSFFTSSSAAAATTAASPVASRTITFASGKTSTEQPRVEMKFSSQAARDAFREELTRVAESSGMPREVAQNLVKPSSTNSETLYIEPSQHRGPGVYVSANQELSINFGNNNVRDFFMSSTGLKAEHALTPMQGQTGDNAVYFNRDKLPPTPNQTKKIETIGSAGVSAAGENKELKKKKP